MITVSEVKRSATKSAEPLEASSSTPPIQSENPQQDFGFIDLLTIVGEGKWIVFGVTTTAVFIGVLMSLIATPLFSSKAVIMPPQQGGGGSAAGALAQLSQVPGLGALGSIAGGKTSEQLYVAFMRSQSLQDTIIKKHDLRKKWGSRSIEDARINLSSTVAIGTEKQSSLVSIIAQDPDPKFAADLANSHVEELQKMLERVATSEAKARRMFYETQIEKTQANLAAAEVRYRMAQENSGIQVTSTLAEAALRTSAELRAKITALEIQLQAASTFVTAKNPDTQRVASELVTLKARLVKLEQGSGHSSATPRQQATMQAYRELKVQESMLDGFVRQLEIAKIDEANEGVPVQVIDVATPAEIRSFPQRTKMVIASGTLGLSIGLVLTFLRGGARRISRADEYLTRWKMLRRAWALN